MVKYHSRSRQQEFAVSVAALDEALTIISQAVDPAVRPHPGATTAARNAIEQLLAVVESTFHEPAGEVPPPPDLSGLREAGIPVAGDHEFAGPGRPARRPPPAAVRVRDRYDVAVATGHRRQPALTAARQGPAGGNGVVAGP